MKWMHEGKEYDVKIKYIKEKESPTQKRLREADEFEAATIRLLSHIRDIHDKGELVKPSDVDLNRFYKRHDTSTKVLGILASFTKGGDDYGWSLVNDGLELTTYYKKVKVPELDSNGNPKMIPIFTKRGNKVLDVNGNQKMRVAHKIEMQEDGQWYKEEEFNLQKGLELAFERAFNKSWTLTDVPPKIRSEYKRFAKIRKVRS